MRVSRCASLRAPPAAPARPLDPIVTDKSRSCAHGVLSRDPTRHRGRPREPRPSSGRVPCVTRCVMVWPWVRHGCVAMAHGCGHGLESHVESPESLALRHSSVRPSSRLLRQIRLAAHSVSAARHICRSSLARSRAGALAGRWPLRRATISGLARGLVPGTGGGEATRSSAASVAASVGARHTRHNGLMRLLAHMVAHMVALLSRPWDTPSEYAFSSLAWPRITVPRLTKPLLTTPLLRPPSSSQPAPPRTS